MKLYLFRISLTEREQKSLLSDHSNESRTDFLRRTFSQDYSINHWSDRIAEYKFVQEDDEVIAGAVCRWLPENREDDPEDPFTRQEGGKWHKSAFFFNIENHQQVFGIEHNTKVGSPSAILAALLKRINTSEIDAKFHAEGFELKERGSFRQAVAAYPGKVTTISFKFVVPNPPNVEEETREALKKLGKITGAETSKETLYSSAGLKTDSQYIDDAVSYVEDGGGEATAKDGQRTIYKSSEQVRTVSAPETLRPRGSPLSNIAAMIKGLLRK